MSLPAWQLAYIVVVIYAAPVVAAVLLWTRYCLAGAWLLVASMAGSLVFGLLYHFLLPGSDNVFTQPDRESLAFPGAVAWQAHFEQRRGGFVMTVEVIGVYHDLSSPCSDAWRPLMAVLRPRHGYPGLPQGLKAT